MKFTVYRDEWLRGRPGSLFEGGERCCLGFLGNACGFTDEQMNTLATPEDCLPHRWPESLIRNEDGERRDSFLCVDIVNVNDGAGEYSHHTDAEREAELTKLFAKGGIEVEFKDTRTPA